MNGPDNVKAPAQRPNFRCHQANAVTHCPSRHFRVHGNDGTTDERIGSFLVQLTEFADQVNGSMRSGMTRHNLHQVSEHVAQVVLRPVFGSRHRQANRKDTSSSGEWQ